MFEQWVKKYGASKLSRDMGIAVRTVNQWMANGVVPRLDSMYAIHHLSKGKVTYQHIVDHCIKKAGI